MASCSACHDTVHVADGREFDEESDVCFDCMADELFAAVVMLNSLRESTGVSEAEKANIDGWLKRHGYDIYKID